MTWEAATILLSACCFGVQYAGAENPEVAPSKVLLDESALDGAERPDVRVTGSAEVKNGVLIAKKRQGAASRRPIGLAELCG